MKLLIFRTDIRGKKKIDFLRSLFSKNPVILDWNIDTHDVDNVLRIEASDHLDETEIIKLIEPYGFYCEALPD
ncbi:hypothetical protein [Catalinimonas niigatensis]|uniref:hypothetical protein n=1 Tax=Catalinimonas niigatensis TaxID=1397264 RepID=UPI00266719FD|nr:hypothetical protein [Catalinimonas niigatensis]WPP49492.1 hypothetical protein PZB72_22740 [Catalinimonas niigatensis]